jgi:hypothetical protein
LRNLLRFAASLNVRAEGRGFFGFSGSIFIWASNQRVSFPFALDEQ